MGKTNMNIFCLCFPLISFIKPFGINEEEEEEEEGPITEGEDRISELPDEILCRILSFVGTTKFAVKTSILSKRWRYVWASVRVLQFNQQEFSQVENFIKFVSRVLQSCEASDVERFTLVWNQGFDDRMATTWLDHAARRNVTELKLDIRPPKEFTLPVSLLHCSSLKIWHLKAPSRMKKNASESRVRVLGTSYNYHPSILHLPTLPDFKQLKTLNLEFMNNRGNVVGKLISGSPSLERLTVNISRHDLDICAPNLKFLCIIGGDDSNNSKVNVCAQSLERLHYSLLGIPEISLKSPQYLVDVRLRNIKHHEDVNAERVVCIMRSICHASTLELYGTIFQSLPKELGLLCLHFGNLRYLKMDAPLNDDQIQKIIMLLHCCPNLESLVIHNTKTAGTTTTYRWNPRETRYKCTMEKLKEIKINRFVGDGDELYFVKSLLEKGAALQIVNICLKEELSKYYWTFERVYRRISIMSKASPTIKIYLGCSSRNSEIVVHKSTFFSWLFY